MEIDCVLDDGTFGQATVPSGSVARLASPLRAERAAGRRCARGSLVRMAGLDPATFAADPITQFRAWFDAAVESGVDLPHAMTLATVGADGKPSARMVLLKGIDQRGLAFYTNYGSRKARELETNPRAALVVCWTGLERQVRVEGGVSRVDAAESDAYFATRPRGSQLGAWVSQQSRTIPDRVVLEDRLAELERRYVDQPVPRPPHWGGYRVKPDVVEFWQGRADRLHDRLLYRRANDRWALERLAP